MIIASELPDFARMPWVAVDSESTGLLWWKDRAFALAVATPELRSYYFDFRIADEFEIAVKILAESKRLVAHHAKFDTHTLREYLKRYAPKARVSDKKWHCTMIRAALLDEHKLAYTLDQVCSEEIGKNKVKEIWPVLAEMYGGKPTKEAQAPNLVKAPRHVVAPYAQVDAELCAELYLKQIEGFEEQDLTKVHDLEFRLFPHIVDMEYRGVPVDLEYAEQASKKLGIAIDEQQRTLDKMAGYPINVNPSNSLKRLIEPKRDRDGRWRAKDGTLLEFTPAGAPSISAEALRSMKMPEARLVLEVRQLRKTKEYFIDTIVLQHHHNGILHATINQTKNDADAGTGTGRFSITDPALQQINKRNKKIAQIVRPCFVPAKGKTWYCRDWSQMDFRMFAHYAKTPAILKIYQDNPDADFHATVADITGLPRNRDELTGGGNAKQINLGLVFGMGAGRMAQEMGLPAVEKKRLKRCGCGAYSSLADDDGLGTITHRCAQCGAPSQFKSYLEPGEEAKALFAKYHENVPGVERTLQAASSLARTRGYVLTMMGRRIRFPPGVGTHKAGGLVFQGTAADALKLKMCEVCEELEGTDSRLMVVVHDEYDLEIPTEDQRVRARVKEIIEDFSEGQPMHFRVPIRSDGGEGKNWAEASLGVEPGAKPDAQQIGGHRDLIPKNLNTAKNAEIKQKRAK
jgi:DNA polymerase I-like protein with 3'-5' exonuclease and polymerase domains